MYFFLHNPIVKICRHNGPPHFLILYDNGALNRMYIYGMCSSFGVYSAMSKIVVYFQIKEISHSNCITTSMGYFNIFWKSLWS